MKKLLVALAFISGLSAYDYKLDSKIYNYSGMPIRVTGTILCKIEGASESTASHTINVVLPDQSHEDAKKVQPYDLDAEMAKHHCTIVSGQLTATSADQKVAPQAADQAKMIQAQKVPKGMKIMDANFKLPGSYTISLGLKAGEVIG